jgi:carbon monoxide dehydrogenase subunit G
MKIIKMNGEIQASVSREVVLAFIANPRMVSSCIPDSKNFNQKDEKNFTIDVSVGIGFVSGIFELIGSLNRIGDYQLTYNIEGAGIGSTVKVILLLDLKESTVNTEILWNAELDLSGVVSGVSESILKKVSEEKIDKIIANVKTNLERNKGV